MKAHIPYLSHAIRKVHAVECCSASRYTADHAPRNGSRLRNVEQMSTGRMTSDINFKNFCQNQPRNSSEHDEVHTLGSSSFCTGFIGLIFVIGWVAVRISLLAVLLKLVCISNHLSLSLLSWQNGEQFQSVNKTSNYSALQAIA